MRTIEGEYFNLPETSSQALRYFKSAYRLTDRHSLTLRQTLILNLSVIVPHAVILCFYLFLRDTAGPPKF